MRSKQNDKDYMNKIATTYINYIAYLNSGDNLSLIKKEDDISKEYAFLYVKRVFKSYMALSDKEKEIINNEYFARKRNGWWIEKYSNREFEAALRHTIKSFINKFTLDEQK